MKIQHVETPFSHLDIQALIKHVTVDRSQRQQLLALLSNAQPEHCTQTVESEVRGKTATASASELLEVNAIATRLVRQGQELFCVLFLYEAVVKGIIDGLVPYQRDYDEFHLVIYNSIEALDGYLGVVIAKTEWRRKAFEILFAIYEYDIVMGGIGLGDDVPAVILRHATEQERQMVVQWTEQALSRESEWARRYRRYWYGGFLLALQEQRLSESEYLHICRETGRIVDAIKFLLEHRHIEEATSYAREATSGELLELGTLLVSQGYEVLAEKLFCEKSYRTYDMRVLDWLKEYYRGQQNYRAALEVALVPFQIRPTLERYRELRRIARKVQSWEILRQQLLQFLRATHNLILFIYIALDEGEIDSALALVESEEVRGGYEYLYGRGPVIVDVASVVQEKRPQVAIELYQRYIWYLITLRGRENYREACKHLLTVRTLYERLQEYDKWIYSLHSLLGRTVRLRALKDEMSKAHLLENSV